MADALRTVLRTWVCLSLGSLISAASAAPVEPIKGSIAAALEPDSRLDISRSEMDALRSVYGARGYEPFWLSNGRATTQATQMLQVLYDAPSYGLSPEDYAVDTLQSGGQSSLKAMASQGRFDVALSAAALRFAEHLHVGRVTARQVDFDLPAPTALNASVLLPELTAAQQVSATLARYEPQSPYYRLLKETLVLYREKASNRRLTDLPALPRPTLEPGELYSGVPQLRELLFTVGDLAAANPDASQTFVYDDALALAVARFQRRHGLEADGRLGRLTLAALTVPLEHRVRQIELALERWRWLPVLPSPLVVINVPQFMLFAFPYPGDVASIPLEIPVIVGRPHTRTPIFVSSIESVVFRPYWDVPYNIATKELLPLIRRNPDYLTQHHMEIVEGQGDDARVVEPTPKRIAALASGKSRLRQRPGPDNALGLIKFVMPNRYSIYLHDTPQEELFGAPRRTFSHGCIRVASPAVLAEYVLRETPGQWTDASIEAAMCGSETLRVPLKKPIRVMVLYATALATTTHGVLFFDDIYGHDRRLEAALESAGFGSPTPRRINRMGRTDVMNESTKRP